MPLTFLQRTFKNSKGMTLIEVMIVLAIVGGVIAVGFTRFRITTNDYKRAVRDFKLLTKQIHSYAKLQNTTYRVVIDLAREEERPEEENFQSYWVESSTQGGLVYEEDSSDENRSLSDDPDKKKPVLFQPAVKILKTKMPLPTGLEFKDVEIQGLEKAQTKGKAYIYFSPQGLVDESVIHISAGEGFDWSFAIHPITGQVDIFTKNISLKDLRRQ